MHSGSTGRVRLAISALSSVAMLLTACGGGTTPADDVPAVSQSAPADDSSNSEPQPTSNDAASDAGDGSTDATTHTTVPDPQPTSDDAASDAGDGSTDATTHTTVPDPQNAAPAVGVTATEADSESATASLAPMVSSVSVLPAAHTLVEGDTLQLAAEAVDANGDMVAEAEFEWASSDTSVVRVDGSGLVVTVAPGEAEVTAVSAGMPGRSALTVLAPVPTTVVVTPDTVALTALGQTTLLAAVVRSQAGQAMTAVDVSWSSADTTVATVDSSGLVTATGNGTATITVTAAAVSESMTVSVAQTVSSVTVSPARVELTALDAAAQMTAEALDENGNSVAGAEFLWESSDVTGATVDPGGVVTAAGSGTTTITATTGDVSGAATVTIAGYTLTGTVRDSRMEGLAVPGATVRLENGTSDSVTTGPDGRYELSNILGQVEVTVTAVPGYQEQTVQVTVVSGDRTLDFVLEHSGEPPYAGTVWITPDILGPSDPSSLGSVIYTGRGMREIFDRRVNMWITVNTYLFEVQFGERTVEFQLNPEFGSEEAAREQVDAFAPAMGRLPVVLMSGLLEVEINAGEGSFGGNYYNGSILIHTDDERTQLALREGFLEEVFVHEGAHISLDPSTIDAPGWRSAQGADGAFISEYARDYPVREDVAESFLPYFAIRHRSDRLTPEEWWFMMTTIPNRMAYFDERQFNMSTESPPSG